MLGDITGNEVLDMMVMQHYQDFDEVCQCALMLIKDADMVGLQQLLDSLNIDIKLQLVDFLEKRGYTFA